jgi:pyridoxal phosphate enzyme (YggS family)
VQPSAIADRIASVRARITAACVRADRAAGDVTLVAVAKGFGQDAIREAIAAVVYDLGENRVQEAEGKIAALSDIRGQVTWHMIGHLQTNKVRAALGLFDIIHSVDSLHLAEEISRRALQPVPVFLEVNVSGEASKFGFSLNELDQAHATVGRMTGIEVRGLMTVAPLVAGPEDIRPVFRCLAAAARDLGVSQLSMGMSDDFEVAIEEGATHVRIGRAIFGERMP